MELKKLKEENAALRKELLDTRTLYNQLVQETSHEMFDERRINMLKSQLIQLERQMLLLSDALTSRSRTILEVENSLSWLAEQCRSFIALDIPGPDVPVPRTSLMEIVGKLESTRIKLYKNIESTSQEALSKPLEFFNDFVKPDKQGEVTLFDLCSGKLDHLNMKQVAKLESRLSQLYKDLVTVHESLTCPQTNSRLTTVLSCSASADRVTTQVLKALARLEDCTKDLLSLSLLYPAAPWPVLKRPLTREVTLDKVVSSLPTLPRSKAGDVHKVLEALTKVTNHKLHLRDQEVKALKDEVTFHNTVYGLQIEYIQALFDAVKTGYRDFEASVEEALCQPLSEILCCYKELENTSSEEALRVFLKSFKDQSENLESTITSLSRLHSDNKESPGLEGLSAFGKDFFLAIEKQCQQVKKTRDQNIRESQVLKEQQEKLDSALAELLKEREIIKSSMDNKEETESKSCAAYKMLLQKNKEEGPRIEFHLKADNGSDENSRISSQLDEMTLGSPPRDVFDRDSDNSLPAGKRNSKLRPPSASGAQSSAKSPVTYSRNRTLNLRRSESLSRGSQSKSPSFLPGKSSQNSQSTNCICADTSGPVTHTGATTEEQHSSTIRARKGSDSSGIPVNQSAKARRKIPTLKAPFR